MSAFGLDPFGTGASAFGGPGLFAILGAIAISANEILVDFDVPMEADGSNAFDSAINPINWALVAVDPTVVSTSDPLLIFVPDGEVVPTRQPFVVDARLGADQTQVILGTDAQMEARVRYDITLGPLVRGEACEKLGGPDTLRFRALTPGPPRRARFVQEDRFRDWDNALFPDDPTQPESTWRLEATTDIALHDELDSLKKRLLRRMLTPPGEFSHLPNYGVDARLKALATTGQVQSLANIAAEQARQEPDVDDAAATVRLLPQSTGGLLVEVELFVRRRAQQDTRFLFQIPV
jgi:hypothetical protein